MTQQSSIINGKQTGTRQFMLLLSFLVLSLFAKAGTDPVVVSVFNGSNNEIKVDSVRETFDPVFYSGNKAFIDDTTKDVYRNVVTLLIDEEDRTFIPANFTVDIQVRIYWWAKDGNMYSRLDTLTVTYDTTPGSKYTARDYVYFDNSRRVKVEIVAIDQHGASWDVTTILKLENRMEIRRDYIFNCANTALNVGAEVRDSITVDDVVKKDELFIYWDQQFFKGITHYDIEWSWIPVEALHRYKDGSDYDATLVFKNNSSRVTISADQPDFAVPLFYDGVGLLFYRVRPVQYREDGQIVEGTWSSATTADDFYYFTGHENTFNWQASTTWAEDGKRSSTLSYYDGKLLNRQTVTKDNTTHTTVVAETFYDYQGRPMINVLPAPTLTTVIAYAKNFNRFANNTADPKTLYDLVPTSQSICNMSTPALDIISGTSNYYSPDNPLVDVGFNKYIPDADGYPYSETRYTHDATGRTAAQGGVGPVHQINSDHDTKYFYGFADQRELNALFGTEVGYASHYFKNMVRDANGQYSVSYVDMHGRTIATALAGTPPANLKALDSYPSEPPQIKKNLLQNNLVKGRSVQSATTLLVPAAGDHQFEYELGPQSAEIIACNPEGQTVCYDCYYDLEIRITGTCNELPIIVRRKNFTFGVYDTSCATPPPSLYVDTTIYLAEGEYNITKTLTLSQDAQNWYRDSLFSEKKYL